MDPYEVTQCCEVLLDLVCYELHLRRLSPEMKMLFYRHLEECTVCRRRVHVFEETLVEEEPLPNFG